MKMLVVAFLLVSQVVAAQESSADHGFGNGPTVLQIPNLSFNAAQEAAFATLGACRAAGYNVTVTVLDRLGRSRVVLNDDDANPHTIENSLRKAYTSLTNRMPSGDYGKKITANPVSVGALSLDKMTTLEGGLPIFAGRELIGAIGVSGSPESSKDAQCARIGMKKIEQRLGE